MISAGNIDINEANHELLFLCQLNCETVLDGPHLDLGGLVNEARLKVFGD
jgi:hypothetical protein